MNRRQPLHSREIYNALKMIKGERVINRHQCVGVLLLCSLECAVEIVRATCKYALLIAPSQACVIGYLARISPIRFKATSAAACGVMFWRITLAWAWPQICAAFASAQPGLKL